MTQEKEFCANCDYEATHIITHDDGMAFFMCESCKDAYEWGQTDPDASVESIEEALRPIPRIKVTQISHELEDVDDRAEMPSGPGGAGSVKFYDVPEEHQATEESALDWFHSNIPIGCLEDFEIEAIQ